MCIIAFNKRLYSFYKDVHWPRKSLQGFAFLAFRPKIVLRILIARKPDISPYDSMIIGLLKDNILTEQTLKGFQTFTLPSILVKNLEQAGITSAKPIQQEAIPAMLQGHDILGIAQTGSGKTLAFSLPLLAKVVALGDKRRPKTARTLILAPTRELAVQIEETVRMASKGAHLATCLILGGVSRLSQIKRMAPGVDVLIATPGRLMDLVREKCVDLSQTRFLVLDEADRMLDMGFIKDVRQIAKLVHAERQTALFSATMPKEISSLADSLLNDPVRIEVAPQGTTAAEILQKLHPVNNREKKDVLCKLLTNPAFSSVIVFTRTKHGADAVTRHLEKTGYSVAAIHGNKSQNARQRALKSFRDGSVRVLVATDIAARGIDVPGISHVINYELPDEAESYVHRIGRTGRNGANGEAITLYDESIERARLRGVERVIRMKLPREEVPPQFGQLPDKPYKSDETKEKSSNNRRSSKPNKRKRPFRAKGEDRNNQKGRPHEEGNRRMNTKPSKKRSKPVRLRKSVKRAA